MTAPAPPTPEEPCNECEDIGGTCWRHTAPPTPEPAPLLCDCRYPTLVNGRCGGCGRLVAPEPAPEAPACPKCGSRTCWDTAAQQCHSPECCKRGCCQPAPEAPCAECAEILRDADGGNVEGAQEWVNAGQHLPGCSKAQPAPEAASEACPHGHALRRKCGVCEREDMDREIAALREQLAEETRLRVIAANAVEMWQGQWREAQDLLAQREAALRGMADERCVTRPGVTMEPFTNCGSPRCYPCRARRALEAK